jgi:hypothetical protein
MEGNDMMEGRDRPERITPSAAKGQIQGWQPLQPHLVRVNAAPDVLARLGSLRCFTTSISLRSSERITDSDAEQVRGSTK